LTVDDIVEFVYDNYPPVKISPYSNQEYFCIVTIEFITVDGEVSGYSFGFNPYGVYDPYKFAIDDPENDISTRPELSHLDIFEVSMGYPRREKLIERIRYEFSDEEKLKLYYDFIYDYGLDGIDELTGLYVRIKPVPQVVAFQEEGEKIIRSSPSISFNDFVKKLVAKGADRETAIDTWRVLRDYRIQVLTNKAYRLISRYPGMTIDDLRKRLRISKHLASEVYHRVLDMMPAKELARAEVERKAMKYMRLYVNKALRRGERPSLRRAMKYARAKGVSMSNERLLRLAHVVFESKGVRWWEG